MKKVLQKISIASIGFVAPAFAFAQSGSPVNTAGLRGLLQSIHGLISLTIPVLISLAVLAFMWGIVVYMFGKDKKEGRDIMLWGIIALFVMTSVWGLVGILRGSLFGNTPDNAQNVNIPGIQSN